MNKIEAMKMFIDRKAKTVDEIRIIYSEVSEEGHKWVHLNDVHDLIENLLNDSGVITHIYQDGPEIQLNIVDENSSMLITFANPNEFRGFKKTVQTFKEA